MSHVQAAVLCDEAASSLNLHWNDNFVNQMRLPSLCEKFGAILLVLVGLRQAGQQSDKILVDFVKFLKFSTDHIIRIFVVFNKGIVLL